MEQVRVHVYTVCWNEERFLPLFLRHYSAFAERIVVFDNHSSDSSSEIVRACTRAELRQFDTEGTLNDEVMLKIKNGAYKESLGEADFVIVVDADELLYHPELARVLDNYKRKGVTLPQVSGYDMMSWRFPGMEQPITQSVRLGKESVAYSKRCIFDPAIDIRFQAGCHRCSPRGRIVESDSAELKLLHYHYLGLVQCIRKHRARGARLSQYNLNRRMGYQFTWSRSRIVAQFTALRLRCHDVVGERRSILSVVAAPLLGAIIGLYHWALRLRMRDR